MSDWQKAGRKRRQVRVEKVNEREPTEDASKILAAVETAGESELREKLGERWTMEQASTASKSYQVSIEGLHFDPPTEP